MVLSRYADAARFNRRRRRVTVLSISRQRAQNILRPIPREPFSKTISRPARMD